MLNSENIFLRAPELADVDILYNCENDTSLWKVSNTQTPFSKHILLQYLDTAHHDIYTNKQLRFMICRNSDNLCIGTADLFDFEPAHSRAGVGILIFEKYRNNGYALESLKVLINYSFNVLLLNQLYCNISENNLTSISLFKKLNFVSAGLKKSWNKTDYNTFEDEWIFQLIRTN